MSASTESSNGRTAGFGPANEGSTPSSVSITAEELAELKEIYDKAARRSQRYFETSDANKIFKAMPRLIAEIKRLREVEKEVNNFIYVALGNAGIFSHKNECYEKVIKGGSREDCVCGVTNVVDAFNKLKAKGGK